MVCDSWRRRVGRDRQVEVEVGVVGESPCAHAMAVDHAWHLHRSGGDLFRLKYAGIDEGVQRCHDDPVGRHDDKGDDDQRS